MKRTALVILLLLGGGAAAHADNAAIFNEQISHACAGVNTDAEFARPFAQMVDKGAGVRQHVVHAWLAVRRFRQRPIELHSHRHQPAKGFRHIVDQQTPQLQIILIFF